MKPALHPREADRLRELRRYQILDTECESDFDEIVELASQLCDAPVSVVNFIDEGRQWFKAEVGLGVRSTPLDTSLCGHVILQDDFVEIPDTLNDPRMSDNPLCTGEPGFRFYAGAILKGANGLPLGTLCVLDHKPRALDATQRRVLQVLARQVMRELDLRLALEQEKVLRREIDHRVKNSLSSIGALISMKARRSKSDEVRAALEDVCVRIRSLAALHAEFHETADGSDVELAPLFRRVRDDLAQLLPSGIDLVISTSEGAVPAGLANSLLLIVNEFVSNSVKHGLADSDGTITIAIEADADGWQLACRDDGSADTDAAERAAKGTGLGTQVIRSIAASLSAIPEWSGGEGGMQLSLAGRTA